MSWHDLAQNDHKRQLLANIGRFWAKKLVQIIFWIKWAKNAHIWPKMPVFGQILPFLCHKSIIWGDGVKLLVSSYQETKETPFPC